MFSQSSTQFRSQIRIYSSSLTRYRFTLSISQCYSHLKTFIFLFLYVLNWNLEISDTLSKLLSIILDETFLFVF